MNAEIKAEWIAALRSGDYKQGRDRLNSGDGFCCLGVLCDLHRKRGLGEWLATENTKSLIYATKVDRGACVLPGSVREWSGLNSSVAALDAPDQRGSLAGANDSGVTFGQIADLIEEYL